MQLSCWLGRQIPGGEDWDITSSAPQTMVEPSKRVLSAGSDPFKTALRPLKERQELGKLCHGPGREEVDLQEAKLGPVRKLETYVHRCHSTDIPLN